MRLQTRNEYQIGLERVVDWVLAHLDEPLDARTLAELAGFSTYHFHRIFGGMMGESIGEFVRRIRLERAAWRLAKGAAVTETAFEAGFESHEAFTRAFRTAFGVPPKVFRASRQLVFHLPNPTGVHFDPSGSALVLRTLQGDQFMQAETKDITGFHTIAIRHVGPYWQIGGAFGRLKAWAEERGIATTMGLAIYHDNPEITPLAELRSDACLVVPTAIEVHDPEVRALEVPGGRYAVATHLGHYASLGETWGRFMGEWLPTSGLALGHGPCFELYVDDCNQVPVEQVRTELYQSIV